MVEKKDGEVVFRCPNPNCPAQVRERLIHFVSKGAMDIDGLGEKIIGQLIDREIAQEPADLFKLKHEDFLKLDKIEQKSADNLIRAIEQSKDTTLPKFIFALGIRHVGEHIAELLAGYFGDVESLIEAPREVLLNIREIGPQIADSVISYFSDESNVNNIRRMLAAGVRIESPSLKGGILEGKVFVVTGVLNSLTRSEVKEMIVKNGGRVASAISSTTDYLVAGESPGSKLQKATEMGITVLKEKELLDLLKQRSGGTLG
jgi:DNA ligase (NAD+)